mgnify:FL=1|tara:strand:- start:2188 stop:2607 length:420 start_codon:yes stop_codon:yes gene_type:complete
MSYKSISIFRRLEVIEGTLDNPYIVTMGDGEHVITADMSNKDGGTNTAMDPHHLLESSLVGCTLMTMEMVAKHKGYSIGNTTVTVDIVKEGATTLMKRSLRFDPALTSEQVSKMTIIADKCPIHKILKSTIEITTETLS